MTNEKERITQIFQLVCVVENLDATLNNWKQMVDFNETSIKRGTTSGKATCIYQGREIQCPVRYARFDLGGVDMKLVEPLNKNGGDPYSDSLRKNGQGFHHIGIYSDDYNGLIKHLGEKSAKPVYEEITESGRCMIYDFNESIGMSIAPWQHMFGPCGNRDEFGKTF